MKIHAYVLAADPCWLEASILSYYSVVEKIIVSYDENRIGWTGKPNPFVDECLERMRAIDTDGKMVFSAGNYGRSEFEAMENDTHQRQCALKEAGVGADWVLQFDSDEALPNMKSLFRVLDIAAQNDISAVDWPMRVLYRRLDDGRFLEVCGKGGVPCFDYPGPIAVRPDVNLITARRTDGSLLRPCVEGDTTSRPILNRPAEREHRIATIDAEDAILHNSFARSPKSIKHKLNSWGDNQGWRSNYYYFRRWLPSKYVWRWLSDFHPIVRGLWPALQPVQKWPAFITAENADRTG